MKRIASFAGLLLALSAPAFAQVASVPPLMNFQGRLTKPNGTPVPDGAHTVVFALYDAKTGGALKWTETDTVTVRNGAFATLLGNTTPLTDALFSGDLWLELKVDGGAALTPRQQLVSVAHAFKADTVPDGSITNAKIAFGTITPDKIAGGTTLTLPFAATLNTASTPFSIINSGASSYGAYFKSGGTNGLYAETTATNGNGILAQANAGTGAYALYGYAAQGYGAVLFGGNFGSYAYSSAGVGAYGSSATNSGVVGVSNGGSGFAGVSGTNNSANGAGVIGNATGDFGGGVVGSSTGNGGVGVSGKSDGPLAKGVSGYSAAGRGVQGESSTGIGVYGESASGDAILGESNNADAVHGISYANGNGVHGVAYGLGYGVYGESASGLAGYFKGSVIITNTLKVNATTYTSDARYKTNVHSISRALDDTLNLRGVSYEWDKAKWPEKRFNDGRQIGFIAQEVEKIFPELVQTDKDGYKSVMYVNIVPVLVEAVKTLNAKVEDQKRQIEDLKSDNAAIKKQSGEIAELKKRLDAVMEALKIQQDAAK